MPLGPRKCGCHPPGRTLCRQSGPPSHGLQFWCDPYFNIGPPAVAPAPAPSPPKNTLPFPFPSLARVATEKTLHSPARRECDCESTGGFSFFCSHRPWPTSLPGPIALHSLVPTEYSLALPDCAALARFPVTVASIKSPESTSGLTPTTRTRASDWVAHFSGFTLGECVWCSFSLGFLWCCGVWQSQRPAIATATTTAPSTPRPCDASPEYVPQSWCVSDNIRPRIS